MVGGIVSEEIIDNLNDEIWSSTGAECLDKLKSYIKDLQQKVEQLESIRKEAIEYIDGHTFYYTDTPYDLLDILKKGDNNE